MPDGSIEIEVELNSEKAEKELKQFSKTLGTETKKAAKSAETAAKQAVKSAETTIKQAAKAAEAATKQASKTTEQAAKRAGKTAETSAKQAGEKASQSTKKSGEEQKRSYRQTEQQAKRSAANAEKYWSGAASKIKSAVSAGMKATGAAMIAGGSAAIKVGSDFEAGMSEVQAISGASGKELESLRDKAKEMGATTKFSATQSAEALKYMAMAGWKADQMVSGLPGIMNLAAASGEDLGTVSDIVTDALTAFGLQAKDSAHFADVLAKASSSSNTNVGMMGETFKYVAPIAGSMKYSVEDTATAIGLMANAGIKGGEAGTSLRAILTRLVKPPKDAAQALDALGVSAKNSDGTMKPLREVIGELREKFSGLDDSQKAQYAASIAGQEAMSGLLAIVNASPSDFDKLTKSIDKSNGAAKKQAKTMNNNLKGALYELGSAAEAVGIEIYDDIKGPLTNAVKAGTKQISSFSKAISKGGIKSVVPEQTITTIKNLGSVAKTVAGGGLKVLGSAAKFLGENMQTALPLATSLLVVLKGYKAAQAVSGSVSALGTALKALNALEKANAITLVAQQGGLTALQTVVGIFTRKITLATAATGAFNAACTALGGPIGMVVLAAGALTAGIAAYAIATEKGVTKEEKLIQQHEKSVASYKKLSKELAENKKSREDAITTAENEGATADILSRKLQGLMKQEHKSAGTKEQIKSIVQQLNQILPDLGLAYDDEKDKLNQSTKAIQRNIKAQRELAVAKAYAAQNEKVAEDIIKTEKDLTKYKKEQKQAEDDLAEATRKREETEKKHKEDPFHTSAIDVKIAKRKEDELKKINDEKLKLVGDTQKKINDLNDEIDSNIAKSTALSNYVEFTNNIDKLSKEAGIKASKIPESIGNGIKNGIYTNPASGEDLLQLIDVDNLLSKAGEAGVKIPEYLAQGLSDGSISFKSAADQLTKGLNYEKLYADAFGSGKKIPESVAAGIQSGQYAVPTSTTAMENLVTFDDLKAKAQNGGVQIPESLANGITSGSMKPKEAAAALGNLMDFQEMIDKAGIQGAQVPTELAQKIVDGKISVDDAIKQMMSGQGLSTDAFGVMNVIDGVAKSTGDSAKKIETNMKVNPVDNSGAASSSFKPFKTESSKAAGETKKNTDSIKKNSKISSTNNAGAGKKTESSYTNELSKGAGKAKAATKKVSSSAVNGFSGGESKAKAAGAKLSGAYVSGISSKSGQATAKGKELSSKTASGVTANKGKIKTAAQSAVNGAKKVSTGGFTSVGKNISSGIASGINANSGVVSSAARKVIQQAKAAAEAEAGIHSPSTLFKNAIGKFLTLGIATGMTENADKAAKASMKVINVTIGAAKKGIPSPAKMFKTLKGETIPKGIAKGVREGQSELVAEMQGVISAALSAAKNTATKGNYSEIGSDLLSGLNNSLSTAKQRSSETVQEIIDQAYNKQVKASEKAENKLQKKIDKLGNKKKNKKKKAKLKEEFKDLKAANAKKEKQLKEAGEKAANAYNTAFEKEADRLTKIAEEKIQALSEKYQEQYDEIKSLRDNLTSKQQSYGSLYDLDQNIYDIEDYQKRLKALENKIPDSMMQRILGMDVEEGRQYMAWFQSLTAAEQKAYMEKWNKQQSMAKNFSESFFKDDFEKINKEYQAAIKKETDNLNAEMKKAGANVAKGLAAGITGETRNLSKAMKKLCEDIVKAAKKELKIKSPSRVFAQIGKFTIQGAEKGQEKEAPKLYRQVETVADTMAARFAKANLSIPNLQGRMQAAVARQMSKITASVQPQVIYARGGGSVTEKTIYTGPEKIEVPVTLEGREIARVTAPYMDSRLNNMADRKARGGV
ncbi:phage tail tape measure protein [Hungatella hathewayi]|nr:phage tail tape measure protein [Hungatella hathewayi]